MTLSNSAILQMEESGVSMHFCHTVKKKKLKFPVGCGKTAKKNCKYSSGTFFYIDGHYQSIYDHISGVPMPTMAMKFQRSNNPKKSKHRKRQLSNLSMEISMERTQMGSFFFLMIIFLIFNIYNIFFYTFYFSKREKFHTGKVDPFHPALLFQGALSLIFMIFSGVIFYSRVLFY